MGVFSLCGGASAVAVMPHAPPAPEPPASRIDEIKDEITDDGSISSVQSSHDSSPLPVGHTDSASSLHVVTSEATPTTPRGRAQWMLDDVLSPSPSEDAGSPPVSRSGAERTPERLPPRALPVMASDAPPTVIFTDASYEAGKGGSSASCSDARGTPLPGPRSTAQRGSPRHLPRSTGARSST